LVQKFKFLFHIGFILLKFAFLLDHLLLLIKLG
jgi:hypothetical protein